MDITLKYYNENAEKFVQGTSLVDFSETQNRFLSKLSPGAEILDFGCGSGRDTKSFMDKGFVVTATDGSKELCELASEFTGIKVKQMLFQELSEVDRYDGIWACSSILHLTKEQLSNVFEKMAAALKANGIIYTSFKYSDFEGERNGRYFTDFTIDLFKKFMEGICGIEIEEYWLTGDVRAGREEEKWLNVILRKTEDFERAMNNEQ
ncbi:MAG: class I SAM-dependent methyltransferase [Eubacterium sp.]|nr:class I SAM-dependent methyltransferase [Eubacterium sp.]